MTEQAGLAVVTHGGAGAQKAWEDGCQRAAEAALTALAAGEDALAAAIRAAVMLEDDPRFNAGFGSRLRMDGKTVEMDAAVMDSGGRLAAVAALTGVRNPVLVAREVLSTPHLFLAGDGAVAFARKRGFPPFFEVSETARRIYEETRDAVFQGDYRDVPPAWQEFDVPGHWNFPEPPAGRWPGCDTIGAVTRDARGRFGVAVSTGGSSPMLRGRVGDTPLVGCGFYAGPDGGVAVTGVGEEIIRRMLARDVYDRLVRGVPAQEACEAGVALFPTSVPVGVIALSPASSGTASNRPMPYGVARRQEQPA